MSNIHIPKFNEIISKSVELYKGSFKVLFYVAIIASVVREFLQVLINKMGMNKILIIAEKGGISAVQNQIDSSIITSIFIYACISGLIWVFVNAICMIILNNQWRRRANDSKVIIRIILSSAFTLIISSILAKVLISFGLMFYIIPGLVLGTLFFVYMPAILFDGKGILVCLQYSFQLAKCNFGSTLIMCILTIFLTIFPDLIGLLIRAQAGMSNMEFGMDEVIISFVSALIIPFVSALILTQYYALRTRAESEE